MGNSMPWGPNLPDPWKPPTFEPLYGFPNGRKERVMIATEEEMRMADVPMEHRDFCAHLFIKWLKCRRDTFPQGSKCKHEKHEHDYCKFEDQVLRMKEYEREKRLLARAERKRKKMERRPKEELEE
ncbi:hypothetical protein ACJMK2_040733 [Sinanodonta woodiana]|uniref:NADH dehydrogenase [ubiquinone] 1 beta subcomplex subunit 7 n=1 Tax=Sinanodonta woodiana TaxID=1069815 RepID=A0ABD3W1Y6_SINWO